MKTINEQALAADEIQKLKTRVAELEALVKFYEEQIRLAKHRQFGASSEKTDTYEQIGLFNEPESTADPQTPEPTVETISYTRKKRVGKREDDLSGLPVETIEYTVTEEEQICPVCGEPLHEMSTEVRRELTIIPAKVKVTEHIRHIYSCRACEKNNDNVPIVKADAPEPLIKGSLASSSAVAQIMVEKYVKAVPLYRQEQSLLRDGIILSRQTMANWMIRCAEDWLLSIYLLLKVFMLKESVLHADETVLQVLHEAGKKASTNSYEWLYRTSGFAEHPIVLYEYQPTRSSAHPKAFLKDFIGYLHTDGYQGYHSLPNVTAVGCWAHVRRKFDEALKVLPADQREGSAAAKGLDFCNRLFALEREFAGLTANQRYQERLKRSKPIAEALFVWAESLSVLPKSQLGKAITYVLGQRTFLENVFMDGRLELSNNRAERSIKPFVIGRKNWLFSNTTKGAKASSIIYSIIETAKENGLKPFEYLRFLLETVPNMLLSDLESVLPWGDDVPAECKVALIPKS